MTSQQGRQYKIYCQLNSHEIFLNTSQFTQEVYTCKSRWILALNIKWLVFQEFFPACNPANVFEYPRWRMASVFALLCLLIFQKLSRLSKIYSSGY